MVKDLEDPRRTEPTFLLAEREMLGQWLEYHRVTLVLKCEGLDDAQRKARPVATSALSLHGLVRHMAEVERDWFRRVSCRRARRPPSGTTPRSRTASSSRSTTPTGRPTSRRGARSARPAGPRPRSRPRRHRHPSQRRAVLAPLDLHAHDRGVRAAQRSRRPDPRARRRLGRLLTLAAVGPSRPTTRRHVS